MPEIPTPKPLFLENSPQGMCDQILWLVKHAQLDFQVKEKPNSLRLSLKKKVAQHWNPQTQFHHQQIPETQGIFSPGQHRFI